MADTENREDQKISECLREAFGYSDDQLLKQLDQANETFKDVNFTGAEDRLMKRFLARKAELEKENASQTPTLVPQNESANIQLAEELPKKTVTVISEAEEKKKNEKKVIRFGKKKVLATAALVAEIAGMLGGTAIGKKSYFFRRSESGQYSIYIDNDRNKQNKSKLEEVYVEIGNKLDIPVLKLKYCPTQMKLDSVEYFKNEVQIQFLYNDKVIKLYEIEKNTATSVGYESDRLNKGKIFNHFLNQNIEYSYGQNENGEQEYETILPLKNAIYCFFGVMPQDEYEEILKNLYIF